MMRLHVLLSLLALALLALAAALPAHSASVSARVSSWSSSAQLEMANAELVDNLEESFLEMRLSVLAELDSQAETEAEAEAHAELEAELAAELESFAELDSELDAELDTEAELDAEAEVETEVDVDAEAEVEAYAHAEAEAEADMEAKVDAEMEAETEAETEVDAEADMEAEMESLAEVAAQNLPAVSPIPMLKPGYQTYGHGAAMGAAWAFVSDSKWALILQKLQPAVYNKVRTLAQKVLSAKNDAKRADPVGDLMLLLENNPVLAAYATYESMRACTGNGDAAPTACRTPLRHEWDVFLKPGDAGNLGELRIAHGNTLTTVAQSLLSRTNVGWNREEVRTAPNANMWLQIFGRAMLLARQVPVQSPSSTQAVQLAASYLRGPNGGLVLDVKSTYSTSAELDTLVQSLRSQYQINVIGVGSFVRAQLAGMKSGAQAVYFYHSQAAVLREALNGVIKQGELVMFNGGSMLKKGPNNAQGRPTYSVDPGNLSSLSASVKLKKYRVAIYAQEPGTSVEAATALVNLSNNYRDVITDGFAWGHVNGRACPFALGNALGNQASLTLLDRTRLLVNI